MAGIVYLFGFIPCFSPATDVRDDDKLTKLMETMNLCC